MNSAPPQTASLTIRPIQRRDLEEVALFAGEEVGAEAEIRQKRLRQMRRWYGIFKCLSLFPNPLQHFFCAYVAEHHDRLGGMIQVSPFNHTRSTWRVDRVVVNSELCAEKGLPQMDVGSQLLRHCFQALWEARTWLAEVDVNDTATLALCRQNGFQNLARMTYWAISPQLLQTLAEREPDLPNLLPVSNADACLLHQLDTVSMPPLVRQVFDRHIDDFKVGVLTGAVDGLKHWLHRTATLSGYVFEPQRKAAIAHFHLHLSRNGSQSHWAQLAVHPAYTWLYPELLAQMARITQDYPAQPLRLTSSDYQPEREEYLEQIGATRTEHTLMMSRSVWHKLRESKFVSLEGLQIAEVLQGLQPARKPVPGRFSLIDPLSLFRRSEPASAENDGSSGQSNPSERSTGLPPDPQP